MSDLTRPLTNSVLHVFVFVLAGQFFLLSESHGAEESSCDEPEYFGICNPFVPGVFPRSFRPGEPSIVVETWPYGPAEKAGICAGDKILAVNGMSVLENTYTRFLEELVSESSSPVHLTIRRGERELEFEVPRVRETTLARLSGREYLRKYEVHPDQRVEGLEDLERFKNEIQAQSGVFDIVKDHDRITGLVQSDRYQGAVLIWKMSVDGRGVSAYTWSPGFKIVFLRGPDEMRVGDLYPQSPAHKAGLRVGDRILEIDGHDISSLSIEEFSDLIHRSQPFELTVKVKRADETLVFQTKTIRYPDYKRTSPLRSLDPLPAQRASSSEDYFYGFSVLQDEDRVLVEKTGRIGRPSPAFDAGLHLGDLIISINGIPVEEIEREKLEGLLTAAGPQTIELRIKRQKQNLTIKVTALTLEEAAARIDRRVIESGFKSRSGLIPAHCVDG